MATKKKTSSKRPIKPNDKKTTIPEQPVVSKKSTDIDKPLKRKILRLPKRPRRVKYEGPKLPPSWRLAIQSLQVLRKQWQLFLLITLIYAGLNIILVRGMNSSINLSELRGSLNETLKGSVNEVGTNVTLFGFLIGNATTISEGIAGAYQSMLMLIVSLALIWSLRQVYADKVVTVRDAFYKGMYPLVPFILLLLVMLLQIVPVYIGSAVYNTALESGLLVNNAAAIVLGVGYFILVVISLYMLSSSVFALYIVTLPDMTPIAALRSARKLVAGRRFAVIRKLLFLPFILLVIVTIIVMPILFLALNFAEPVLFGLMMAGFVVAQSYIYTLYRNLLA